MPRHSSRTHSGRRGLACWVGQFKVKLVETKMFCYAACSRIRSRCRYLARYGGARYHRDGGVPQIQQRGAACRCQLARAGPGLQLPVPEERGKSADAAFSLRQCTLQTWILTVTPPPFDARRLHMPWALATPRTAPTSGSPQTIRSCSAPAARTGPSSSGRPRRRRRPACNFFCVARRRLITITTT